MLIKQRLRIMASKPWRILEHARTQIYRGTFDVGSERPWKAITEAEQLIAEAQQRLLDTVREEGN